MFQTAVGNASEDPPVGSDLIDSATAEASSYEPEIWAVLLFGFGLITISLVFLRKLESHFFAKPAPQTIAPHYWIGRVQLLHKNRKAAIQSFERYLRVGGQQRYNEVMQTLQALQPDLRIHDIR